MRDGGRKQRGGMISALSTMQQLQHKEEPLPTSLQEDRESCSSEGGPMFCCALRDGTGAGTLSSFSTSWKVQCCFMGGRLQAGAGKKKPPVIKQDKEKSRQGKGTANVLGGGQKGLS